MNAFNYGRTRFYKEKDQWYADIPQYPGPVEDLQMVFGADTLLDILSSGKDEITLRISLEDKLGDTLHRTEIMDNIEGGGALYKHIHVDQLWLCPVMEFVFGGYPETIYFDIV